MAIPSYFHYAATRQFDEQGDGSDRPRYVKDELRLFLTYGLRDAVTLGFDGAARRVRDDFPGAVDERLNWSETSLFARVRLAKWRKSVLSVQPLVRLPVAKKARGDLGRDTDAAEAELRFLYGRNFQLFRRGGFAIGELGYRRRFGAPGDQIRADATLGFSLTPRLVILGQSFNILSVQGASAGRPGDYTLYKAQLSLVRELTPHLSVQIGGFIEYAGRNTGAGQAGFVALWIRL